MEGNEWNPRVPVLPFLPEDGRRSSFRNVVILLKYRRWAKSKKTVLQTYISVMNHKMKDNYNVL
jgi:hypothetical protein